MARGALLAVFSVLLVGCASAPPAQVDNVCAIFDEKAGWYQDAADARKTWGSPIGVMMAIMHQESRFDGQARPPRKRIFGFIPGPRPSSSYGYSQAKNATWNDYRRRTGQYGADRDDFGDAIDFIGWYNQQSHQRSGIALDDPYRLYLAYHEGQGGFNRRTYRKKPWLLKVAGKVKRNSERYTQQLRGCEKRLKKRRRFFNWF